MTEQKIYTEDVTFGASAFPAQLTSELTFHPYAYSAYALESTQYDHSQAHHYPGVQMVKSRNERVCPVPQETKAVCKKKSYDERKICAEQKFHNKRTDGSVSSDIKSDGYRKRTDKKSKIVAKGPSNSKPEFEFSRLDFPELQGPKNNNVSEIQKQPRWGPLQSPASDISRLDVGKPVTVMSEGEIVKTNTPSEAVTDDDASSSDASCTRELSWTPMGYVVRQTVSSESSPVPKNVASMVNLKTVASAEAKNVSTSFEVLSSDTSYSNETHIHPTKKAKVLQSGELEQNEASRKNKKKKEKSKPNLEVMTVMVQEPPRIEDAEEFPNLAAASERKHRVESPKFTRRQTQNDFKASGKKSQVPVQLDLGGMLAALEKQQRAPQAKPTSRPVVFSVGAVPVLSKEASSGERGRRSNQVKTPHNPLDSSAPLMKKGKQREVPKVKKPTSLKKIILKERQERKQQRLQENAVSPSVASSDVPDAENSADDQASGQGDLAGPESIEESASSTPVLQGELEEPPGMEPQRDPEACQPDLNHTTFPKIHSRRFRDYCSQMLSKEVDSCVSELLKELVRFQDRMYQKDPVKAKTKRRLVLGLREVLKHLKLRKLKCIIISPNCEKIQAKGGLDDTLHTIIDYACEQNIPFVFALNRKALGRSLNKAVPVSVVGIFSYDGAQDQFHKMIELTMAAREAYKTMLENAQQEPAGVSGSQSSLGLPTQDSSCSSEDGPPASTGKEPHYIEIWRKHLDEYSEYALELEDSLAASTSKMMSLNL